MNSQHPTESEPVPPSRRIFMTLSDVEDSIREIQDHVAKGDLASADILEKTLHMDALAEIAHGHPDPVALSKAALQTINLSFERLIMTLAAMPAKRREQLFNTLALPPRERDHILGRLS